MAVSRLGLIGVGRERYKGFQPKTSYQGRTRLGLIAVPRERYRTETTIVGSAAVTAVTATASGSGSVGGVSRLGLSAVPRERYKGFEPKTALSAATRTGSGTPQAQIATVNSVGAVGISGAGAVVATTATASGVGLRVITGIGIRRGWVFPLDQGWFNSSWWIDAQKARRATATTAIISYRTGSGSPQAQTATISVSALRIVTGSGTPTAENSTLSSRGFVDGYVAGFGHPQAQTATSTGSAQQGFSGSGSVSANRARVRGIGGKSVFGSAAITADTATTSANIILLGSWYDTTDQSVTWSTDHARSLPIAWQQTDSLTSDNIRSIWYESSQDLWVACGDNGTIFTRPGTETTWTQQLSGTANSLRTVKYWNNRWWICGYNGTLLYSNDATGWLQVGGISSTTNYVTMSFDDDHLLVGGWFTSVGIVFGYVTYVNTFNVVASQTLSSNKYVYGITYNSTANQFVIAGQAAANTPFYTMAHSSGTSMIFDLTYSTPDFATSIWSIDWNGQYYVAGTELGVVKYSSDLTTWTASTISGLSGDWVWRITNGGVGNVVVCGGFNTGKVYYSSDYGVTFSLAFESTAAEVMSKAHYGDGQWIAVGWAGQIIESLHGWQSTTDQSTTWTKVSYG